ncbi:hypothetical protein [Psychrobacter frigidicola]|uniref:hypothetical protein n=1 Tax=Psychrobacter frigidicola TaxID=45611 RepID=UPI00191B8678|nr:hypothetical protein [Psychrobacter frigidicola]
MFKAISGVFKAIDKGWDELDKNLEDKSASLKKELKNAEKKRDEQDQRHMKILGLKTKEELDEYRSQK